MTTINQSFSDNNANLWHRNSWQFTNLFLIHIIATLIYLSLYLEPTQSIWRYVDEKIFFTLNGLVANNYSSQIFWAIMNIRAIDALVGVMMFIPFCKANWFIPDGQRLKLFINFLSLLLIYVFLKDNLQAYVFFDRTSPSLMLEPSYLLGDLIPWIPSKDRSHQNSFPGDHASILLLWAYFLMMNSKNKIKWLTIPFIIIFTIPRLVSGAHWFSDVLNGSIIQVMLVLAWVSYTPIARFIAHALTLGVNKVLKRVQAF